MRYAVIFLMLTGCATPYWVKSTAYAEYVPNRIDITQTDGAMPCEGNVLGCAIRLRGSTLPLTCAVWIKASLEPAMKECVLNHELKHCLGYDHNGTLGVDCG